jgi:hypothetical protein
VRKSSTKAKLVFSATKDGLTLEHLSFVARLNEVVSHFFTVASPMIASLQDQFADETEVSLWLLAPAALTGTEHSRQKSWAEGPEWPRRLVVAPFTRAWICIGGPPLSFLSLVSSSVQSSAFEWIWLIFGH